MSSRKNGKRRFWIMALPLPASATLHSDADDDQRVDEARWDLFNKVRARLFEAVGNNAEYFPIDLPSLKVGSLDGLMSTSEELEKVDPSIEGTLHRLIQSFQSIIDDDNFEFDIYGKRPEVFLSGFTFNISKYRTDTKLHQLITEIHEEVNQIDALVKSKLSDYSTAKNAVAGADRNQRGTLLTKDLAVIVEEYLKQPNTQIPIQSDYMTSVYLIVPKADIYDLESEYLQLAPMIVPDTLKTIATDEEYRVYTITIFKKHLKELQEAVRKRKWTLKEYEHSAEIANKTKTEQARRQADTLGLHANLVRLLKTNVAEVFSCCAHIKFIKCFVEATLRYGLPPHYLFMVINIKHGSEGKQRTDRRLLKHMVRLLEQLALPGISSVDLISFAQVAGADNNGGEDVQGDEAEMWTALNAGGLMDDAPFVRSIFEW